MTAEAISLGKFHPSSLNHTTIANELDLWLKERGIAGARMMAKGKLPIAVRGPEEHLRYCEDPTISQWHRDGLSGKDALSSDKVPASKWIIFWSNGTPTHLRGPGGILVFEPFDVVLVDNEKVFHKAPPAEAGRWFARLLDPQIDNVEYIQPL